MYAPVSTTHIIRKHGLTGAELNYEIATDPRILRLTPGNDVVAASAKAATELGKMFRSMGWESIDCMPPATAKRYGW